MPIQEPENRKKMPESNPAETIRAEIYLWLQALVTALVVLVLVFTFFGRIIAVDGGSMLHTLDHNDRLLLQSIGYHPRQGDIVVLTKNSFLPDPIVKRIVATEGQTVEIDYTAGIVKVDGEEIPEPYLSERMEEPYWANIKTVTVPENCVFVMGDNRNHSSDSRDPRLGVVDERYIIGRALFVIYPFSHIKVKGL